MLLKLCATILSFRIIFSCLPFKPQIYGVHFKQLPIPGKLYDCWIWKFRLSPALPLRVRVKSAGYFKMIHCNYTYGFSFIPGARSEKDSFFAGQVQSWKSDRKNVYHWSIVAWSGGGGAKTVADRLPAVTLSAGLTGL